MRAILVLVLATAIAAGSPAQARKRSGGDHIHASRAHKPRVPHMHAVRAPHIRAH